MTSRSACLVGAAFAAGSVMLAPSVGVAGASNGVTALLVGGEGSYAQLTEEQMSTAFGGYFANYDARVSVPFPGDAEFAVSIPEGSDNLYNAIYEHQAAIGTPLTIGGVSKGAPSVVDVLYRLMDDAESGADGRAPPGRHDMSVAIYGAPGRVFFLGVEYQPLPETPYDTVIVSAEYDGIADFPDNPFSVLALLNALAGAESRHVEAAFYDVANNPTYYRVDTNSMGAKTTTVVIPTERLPLLNDMYASDFWDPGYVRFLEKVLRPVIDSAYKRHWPSQRKLWQEGIVPMPQPPAGGTSTLIAESVLAEPESELAEWGAPRTGQDERLEQQSFDDSGDDVEYVGRHRYEPLDVMEADELSNEAITEEGDEQDAGREEPESEKPALAAEQESDMEDTEAVPGGEPDLADDHGTDTES